MLKDFDPKERKVMLVVFVALALSLVYFSGDGWQGPRLPQAPEQMLELDRMDQRNPRPTVPASESRTYETFL